MKKICMLSLTHSLKDDRIFYKESLSLKKHGYAVTHIGGIGADGKIRDMGGKVLNEAGESSIFINGINCIGIPLPPGFMQNIFKKFFLGIFYRDYIQTAVSESADVYHAHEPQAYYLALKIAKLTNAKVIYDAHESWLTGSPKDKYIKWRYLKKMTFLISANGITRDSLVKKNSKIIAEVIPNASVIQGSPHKTFQEIVIAHEGSFPFNRGLKLFLSALELLRKKTNNFSVKIIGGFAKAENDFFQTFIKEHQMQSYMNVTGWKPYELVEDELEGASIGVILNTPTLNNIYAGPPNKLFNYIAKNMCVVAVELPETVRVINKYSCGVVLKNREAGHLAEVLYKLIMDPNLLREKQLAAHEAHKVLNWEMESQKLLKFYDSVFSD